MKGLVVYFMTRQKHEHYTTCHTTPTTQDEWHEMKKKKKPSGNQGAGTRTGEHDNTPGGGRATDAGDHHLDNLSAGGDGHLMSNRGRRDRGMGKFAGRGMGRGLFNGVSNSRERTNVPGGYDSSAAQRGRRRGGCGGGGDGDGGGGGGGGGVVV